MHKDRPSNTARLVANWLHFQLFETKTYHLGNDSWREWSARVLRASGLRGRSVEFFASADLLHGLYQAVPAFYQSFSIHLLFRKLWVEACTRHFLRQTLEAPMVGEKPRVIVVGAGLDTLALRLAPEFPQSQFIEADHPATQSLKHKALAQFAHQKQSERTPDNLHLVAADLTQLPLSEALSAQGLGVESAAPTFVILEGLFMYLSRDIVQGVMHDLTQLGSAPQVVFTFLAPWQYPILRQTVTNLSVAWLKLWREPFEWIIQPADLRALLAEWGWSVDALRLTADVAQEDFQFPFSESIAEQLCLVRYVGH